MEANVNVNTDYDDEMVGGQDEDDLFLMMNSDETIDIEKKLRVEDFRIIGRRFNRGNIPSATRSNATKANAMNCLTKEEFLETFETILDTKVYGNQLEKLFDKLNSKETGFINWNDFCTYMLQFYQEEDYENTLRTSPFNSEPKIRHVSHNKQELTAKILHLENPVKFINISKEGYLGLWTTNLNLEKTYSAAEEADESSAASAGNGGQGRRRAGMWITDAIYMADAHKLVLASTSRDLRFFTISSETFLEDFALFGVKNVPTCLDYYPSLTNGNTESALMFGDDCGFIHILYFKSPVNSLFDTLRRKTDSSKLDKTSTNTPQRIFWDELKDHDKYVRYYCMGAVHKEYVRKILYIPHNNSIIASSGDNRNSLIISNVNKLKKPYVFRLYKGCECFDYSKELNVLITGGADYLARIWNPYVTQKNTAILEGHHSAVIDVKINDRLIQCYTFSKDAVVKAWDLKEFVCLQTISIRFPTTLGGKIPSFGPFPADLYLNASLGQVETSLPGGLVLACNDYLCLMKLGQETARDGSLTETHASPVSCAVYNSRLKQLITCGNNSSLGAWDIDTGRKVFFMLDAHDGEEITSIAIDRPCRKIATGARNGVVKIWNSANGQNLHVLPSIEDAEITGILFSDKGVITVGWSRKIVKYPDIISELVVPKADISWRGGQTHRDDILCLENLLPISNIMCTASYDGEIHVWSIDTEKLIISLRKAPRTDGRRVSNHPRRSSAHRAQAATRGPAPVDKLLFLRHRAKENMKLGVLLSSEAGNIHCWSLYGERKEMGTFYAAAKPGESVLALATDTNNRYLISGDTTGEIRVWNIENYCCSLTSPVPYESSPPPLIYSWQAHLSPIIYCEWTDYKGNGDFVLTGATDHTARLWTMRGDEIGVFGQRQQWDIEAALTSRSYTVEKHVEETDATTNENESKVGSSATTAQRQNQLIIPELVIDDRDEQNDKRPLSNTNTNISEKTRATKSGLTTSDHPFYGSKNQTGLGITIEQGLTQQKLTRQKRRSRFSDIDVNQLGYSGVSVTPYALLFTQEIDDNISNINPSMRQNTFDDIAINRKDDTPSNNGGQSKTRMILPPIVQNRRTASSVTSNSGTISTHDNDPNNLYSLPSRQNTTMKSISEIF